MNGVPPRRHSSVSLPELAPEVLAHGAHVTAFVREQMAAAGGVLDFAEFMRLALYAPGLGYYAAGMAKFGGEGDFVTAPEVSPLFARALARQVAQCLQPMGAVAEVLEFGAGSGVLAVELLLTLERLGALPSRYVILEVSASLRAMQHERLLRDAPHLLARVAWLDTWPEHFVGVMLGNEVLDAMPLRVLKVDDTGVSRLAVKSVSDGFDWARQDATAEDLNHLASLERQRGAPFPTGYRVEFHPDLPAWMAGLSHALQRGVVFLLDYGATAQELYATERWMGTMRCHVRHHAHDDPLVLVGVQDITAWVDFSRVAHEAARQGLDVLGYTTQAHFLLGCGLAEIFEQSFASAAREVDRLQLAQGFKTLMMPGEMGERFKVIALGRGVEFDLLGFEMRDFRQRL